MADPNAIATEFAKFYYNTFDTNRQGLTALYRDNSMLSFEGQPFPGAQAITEKLTTLGFEKVLHRIVTLDAQPLPQPPGSMIILVTGELLVDDTEHPIKFSQTFTLLPDGGSYYVQNDVFRLNYG